MQALFEDGVLQRNGSVKLAKSMNAVKVPTTVQAVLAARIDRLPPDEKELLQTLAVIGREFALSLVRQVVGDAEDNELERMLADLQMGEFIYEQPAAGDTEYIFKHALTQEVTYNSTLDRSAAKRCTSGRAKRWSLCSAQASHNHYDALAHHYQRSGKATKAIHFPASSRRAGNESISPWRGGRAIYSRARTAEYGAENVERDRTEIAIRLDLALCLVFTVASGFSSINTVDSLERARELCRSADDDASLSRVLERLRSSMATGLSGNDHLAQARNF